MKSALRRFFPSKMDDLSDLPILEDSDFKFNNQRALLTYKTHVDKKKIKSFLGGIFGAHEVEVAHENGENGDYPHTHVYVNFGKAIKVRNCRKFDVKTYTPELVVLHPHIKKICNPKHVERVLRYLAKEDPENAHLLELAKAPNLCDSIYKSQDLATAMKYATKFSDACGIKAMFEARPRRDFEIMDELSYDWHFQLQDELLIRDSNRVITWIFERTGNTRKSTFCRFMEDAHDCLHITQMGGSRDLATVIQQALERDNWNNGVVIVDLPRDAQQQDLYKPFEMILNGRMTALKYTGGRLRWRTKALVVFANFPPEVNRMSWDRWDIRELVGRGETLTLINRSPSDFTVSGIMSDRPTD